MLLTTTSTMGRSQDTNFPLPFQTLKKSLGYGKVLVLDPTVLKDQYKSPDFQLFLADGGFGCSPMARGRRVYGQFLKDGEETSFYRQDFIGVLKDEHLPDWAMERLTEIQTQDSGPQMGQ